MCRRIVRVGQGSLLHIGHKFGNTEFRVPGALSWWQNQLPEFNKSGAKVLAAFLKLYVKYLVHCPICRNEFCVYESTDLDFLVRLHHIMTGLHASIVLIRSEMSRQSNKYSRISHPKYAGFCFKTTLISCRIRQLSVDERELP